MSWHNESSRHSLAARGIKTRSNPVETAMKTQAEKLSRANMWAESEQFIGTEGYTKGYLGVLQTDGINFIAEKAGWLISDVEAIVKAHPKVKREEFVAIKIKAKDGKADVTYEDGNDNKIYKQHYAYAEIPDGEKTLYYTDGVLMLSNEY